MPDNLINFYLMSASRWISTSIITSRHSFTELTVRSFTFFHNNDVVCNEIVLRTIPAMVFGQIARRFLSLTEKKITAAELTVCIL